VSSSGDYKAVMSHPSRQTLMDKAIADRMRCRDWLFPHMIDGRPKAFTKAQYQQMAMAQLGVSKAVFNDAWIGAIEDAGRHDWYDPSPRTKRIHH